MSYAQKRRDQRTSDNCEAVIRGQIEKVLGARTEPAETDAKRACAVPRQEELDAMVVSIIGDERTLGEWRERCQLPTLARAMAIEYSPVTPEGYKAFFEWMDAELDEETVDPSDDNTDFVVELATVLPRVYLEADLNAVVTGLALVIAGAEPGSTEGWASAMSSIPDLWHDTLVESSLICLGLLETLIKDPQALQQLVAMDLLRHRGRHLEEDTYPTTGMFETLLGFVMSTAEYVDSDEDDEDVQGQARELVVVLTGDELRPII